jgi:hypothetical protein
VLRAVADHRDRGGKQARVGQRVALLPLGQGKRRAGRYGLLSRQSAGQSHTPSWVMEPFKPRCDIGTLPRFRRGS